MSDIIAYDLREYINPDGTVDMNKNNHLINIVHKGFAHIPDEAKHCPVCGKYEQFYCLKDFQSDNPNLMALQHTGDFIQKYPTFTCGKCQTIWQYLGKKEEDSDNE